MTKPISHIFDATLPQKGENMGIRYDEKRKAWLLDYAVRRNGKPVHLRATIKGSRRQTQKIAFEAWCQLEEQAKNPLGSLTFAQDVEKYMEAHPGLRANNLRVIAYLVRSIGHVKRKDLRPAFEQWIEEESSRGIRKLRRVDGELMTVELDRPISAATVQAYTRIAKAICPDVLKGIKVGSAIARHRPIEPWEMLELERVISERFQWFYSAFDFARKNPVRPRDQFGLTGDHVTREPLTVTYLPAKTKKTRRKAYPIIWPGQEAIFNRSERGVLIFPRPDGGSMLEGHPYYSWVWSQICKRAGVSGLAYYDLRHHAVAWMRGQGLQDWRIQRAAGWSSAAMLEHYDPDNEYEIRRYDTSLLRSQNVANNVADRGVTHE